MSSPAMSYEEASVHFICSFFAPVKSNSRKPLNPACAAPHDWQINLARKETKHSVEETSVREAQHDGGVLPRRPGTRASVPPHLLYGQ